MKNFLLSIAIFLAVCINGILISEMPGKATGTEIAINDKTTSVPEVPVVKKEEMKVTEKEAVLPVPQEQVQESELVVTSRVIYYQPRQPVRNFFRFLLRPLRRPACFRSLYIQQ